MVETTDVRVRDRFVQGVLLTWIPFFIVVVPFCLTAFRGIAASKATGVGAVVGGWSEGLCTFGVVAMLACQVAAIVFLSRRTPKGSALRSLFAVFSIFCSVLMIAVVILSTWSLWHLQTMLR
jgi:hypothetical protein